MHMEAMNKEGGFLSMTSLVRISKISSIKGKESICVHKFYFVVPFVNMACFQNYLLNKLFNDKAHQCVL